MPLVYQGLHPNKFSFIFEHFSAVSSPLLSIFSESNLSGSVSCWTILRFADPVHVVSTRISLLITVANVTNSRSHHLMTDIYDLGYSMIHA
jgi:hypothetical protein